MGTRSGIILEPMQGPTLPLRPYIANVLGTWDGFRTNWESSWHPEETCRVEEYRTSALLLHRERGDFFLPSSHAMSITQRMRGEERSRLLPPSLIPHLPMLLCLPHLALKTTPAAADCEMSYSETFVALTSSSLDVLYLLSMDNGCNVYPARHDKDLHS